MAKRLGELLKELGIDSANRKQQYIGLYSGPYSIWQDGTQIIAPYSQYGNEVIETIKFMSPSGQLWTAFSRPEAFDRTVEAIAVRIAKNFSMLWTAMFDQLKGITADLKDNGGLIVFPERRYWQRKVGEFQKADAELKIKIREEMEFVLTECIGNNYRETERTNKLVPPDKQAKSAERTRDFIINLSNQNE